LKEREYQKMYETESSFWWFVGKGLLLAELARAWLPEEGTFLDTGCGTGANLDRLSGRGKWTGADVSPHAASFCARRGHPYLVMSEACRLPFEDGSFDGAVALDLFEHLREDGKAVAELLRCLRPGGRLLVTVPACPFLWSSHDVAMGHVRRYSRPALISLLSDAGFIILKITNFLGLLFPPMLAGRVLQKLGGDPTDTISYEWPDFLNRFLTSVIRLELLWLRRFGMPWGTTLVAVCEKPLTPSIEC